MTLQYINTGTNANAGNGDSIRSAFTKVNNNFERIAAGDYTIGGGNGYTGSKGNIGYVGSSGYVGSQGIQGPAGGYTGSKGDQGDRGQGGYTGSQGVGYTGSQGYIGSASTATGYTGSQGITGFTGSTGTQGITGFTGSKGDASGNANTANFVFTASQVSVSNNSDITMVTNANTWTFGTDGGLIFPDTTVQTTAYPGVLVPANGDNVSGTANLVFYAGTDWYHTSKVGINPATGFLTLAGTGGAGGIILPNSARISAVDIGIRFISSSNGPGGVAVQENSLTVGIANPTVIAALVANPGSHYIDFNSEVAGATIASISGPQAGTNIYTLTGTWPANATGFPITVTSTDWNPGVTKVDSDSGVIIETVSGSWTFGEDGVLTFPQGSTINDTAGAPGNGNGQSVEIKPGGASNVNQLLKIYPTVPSPDGNHIHITSGDLAVTDLFLGNDNQFVQIAVDGKVCIGTYDTAGHFWQFGTDGILTIPDDIQDANGSVVRVATTSTAPTRVNGQLWFNTEDGRSYIRYNNNWIDASPPLVPDLSTYLDGLIIDGTTISAVDTTATVSIESGSNVWEFGTDGSLTLPEGGVIKNSTGTNILDGLGGAGANFEYSTVQEGLSGGPGAGGVTSITGNHDTNTGVGLTSNEWAQLMWVPDTSVVTVDDIDNGPDVYNWAYVNDIGFHIDNVITGTTHSWLFGYGGKTSLASGVEISNTGTFNFLSWNTGTALIIADIPYSAGSYIYIPSSSDTSGSLGIVNTNTSGTIMLTQGTGNTTNQLFVNNSGTTINNILSGISKTWTFGTDGSLTFPDATVQTTAYTTGQTTVYLNISTEGVTPGFEPGYEVTSITGTSVIYFIPDIGYSNSTSHYGLIPIPSYPGQKLTLINDYDNDVVVFWQVSTSTTTSITLDLYANSELTAFNHPTDGLLWWETNRYNW